VLSCRHITENTPNADVLLKSLVLVIAKTYHQQDETLSRHSATQVFTSALTYSLSLNLRKLLSPINRLFHRTGVLMSQYPSFIRNPYRNYPQTPVKNTSNVRPLLSLSPKYICYGIILLARLVNRARTNPKFT